VKIEVLETMKAPNVPLKEVEGNKKIMKEASKRVLFLWSKFYI
jgi:hypothetical protein